MPVFATWDFAGLYTLVTQLIADNAPLVLAFLVGIVGLMILPAVGKRIIFRVYRFIKSLV